MSDRVHVEVKAPSVPTPSFAPVQSGLLQRKSLLGRAPGLAGEFTDSRRKRLVSQPPLIQAKLTINQPNDRYEQEADRVADAVMRMPEPQVQRQVEPEEEEEEEEALQTKPLAAQITPLIQRQIEPEEEEGEEELIQAKDTSGQTPHVSPIVQTQIHSLRGGGQRLSPSLRNFFEPRFGHDFSRVRVHTDAKAAESTRAANARAFTIGRDVVFGAGRYAPETAAGKHLIAHELTHVIQQNSSDHNISPETKEPVECIFGGVSKGGCVQVRQKKPAGISLAVMEENGTDRSQQLESERKLGFCDEFINEIESLASGSDNKQWRSQDLNLIGRLAIEYMDASQLRALSDELEIPSESEVSQEAVTETPAEGVIQRDAAAAGAVAGTMWWLTLVDGPLPVGDLVYLGLIAIAAVAVATTASRRMHMRRCRCTIRYAPPDIMAQCPPRVYGVGVTMHDCQNNAKFTAAQQCRRYYGHCGWV